MARYVATKALLSPRGEVGPAFTTLMRLLCCDVGPGVPDEGRRSCFHNFNALSNLEALDVRARYVVKRARPS